MAVVEHSDDAVFGTDLSGRIVSWNPAAARLFGYRCDEILGRSASILAPTARLAEQAGLLQAILQGRPVRQLETVRLRKDGTRVDVALSAAPIRDASGRVTGISVTERDITGRHLARRRRRDLERQAREALRAETLSFLARGIAHDFNNLLTSILGNAELAAAEVPAGSPAHECIEDIRASGRQAAELVNSILAYAGRGRCMLGPVNLADIVAGMAPELAEAAGATGNLAINFAPDLPSVEVDADQVRQLLDILVRNAAEAIGKTDGRITLAADVASLDAEALAAMILSPAPPPGRFLRLSVTDTGCGMDGRARDHATDPFFTTKQPGRGLGLAAVRGIVQGHDGTMRIESEPGRGTTVEVYFPLRDE
jgi:PAS domain S-box-containing protein